MKKVIMSMVVGLALVGSTFAAEYWSGWKYVTSMTYDFNAGKLTNVKVWLANTSGGEIAGTVTFQGADLLVSKDLNKMIGILELAKDRFQRVHIINVNDNIIKAGEFTRVDSEDN